MYRSSFQTKIKANFEKTVLFSYANFVFITHYAIFNFVSAEVCAKEILGYKEVQFFFVSDKKYDQSLIAEKGK